MTPQGTRLATVLSICCLSLSSFAQPAKDAAQDVRQQTKPVLSLAVHCAGDAFRVGDEIPVDFLIENTGTTEYKYLDRNYDRSGRMGEYELSAVDEQGHAVPDPRAKQEIGSSGGLCQEGTLAPGKSFRKTIALNRWALLTKPGTYEVVGVYRVEGGGGRVVSKPITVTIQPRTNAEMDAYIERLKTQLATTKDEQACDVLMEKLTYTCDPRIVPTLIEAMYTGGGNAAFWAREAFDYYLPDTQEATDAQVRAASERGLAWGMFQRLKQHGMGEAQIKPLIDVSLAPEHPDAWAEGALAAQQYADDRFTPRLVAIATDRGSNARAQAIYALAFNRSDESVAVLKKLLKEPEPPDPTGRTISQTVTQAIRMAYMSRGNTHGRPLRKDDFGPEFQKPN